jgi:tetratricopeptide (TPR) repeat protein
MPRRTVGTDAGKDFFISYTSPDKKWAEWIAWQLEEAQYSTILQAWDFQPGMNFVLEMDKAARVARCTIVVLSPAYLSAQYTQPEWAVAFRRDPKSKKGALLPVRVQKCEVEGLLGPIVYIDLVDLDEAIAHEALLVGVRRERGKPDTAPGFPGGEQRTIPEPQRFPGALPPLWNVPYHRNPQFTGREEILQRLQHHLVAGTTAALTQPQAISGLGGIGKTQTAVEFAYRVRPDYHAVLWLQADSQEMLASECIQLMSILRLPAPDEQNPAQSIEEVRRWLRGHIKWLLILDNVEDLQIVQEFLPAGHLGCVLLTTRAQVTGPLVQKHELQKMSEQEGVLFLLHRTEMLIPEERLDQAPKDEYHAAKQIWQLADGLPLALDQAGAYILETGCDFSTYCEVYQQHRSRLLRERGKLFIGHPESVATTLLLCLEKIEQMNSAAADILRLCAILRAEAIPEELFTGGTSYFAPSLASVASDLHAWNKALSVLRAYSLVQRNSNENTLTVHRLLQEVLKDEMGEQEQSTLAASAVQALNHIFPQPRVEYWPLCKRYLSQALECESLIEQWDIGSPEAAQLLNKVGEYLFSTNPQSDVHAAYMFQSALAIQQKVLKPNHPDIAKTLNNQARSWVRAGAYEYAAKLYKQALAIREEVLGPDHPDTATTLDDLARLYSPESHAEPLYQRALAIREKVLGPDHPDTAITLNNLAQFYQRREEYEKAEPLLRRALKINEKVLGPESYLTATVLNNLALLLKKQGKYDQAEPLYQRALHIREQSLDADHPVIEESLYNLALLYKAQRKYKQAKPLLRRAYEISKKVFGANDRTIDILLHLIELDLPKDAFEILVDYLRHMRFLNRFGHDFMEVLDPLEKMYLRLDNDTKSGAVQLELGL